MAAGFGTDTAVVTGSMLLTGVFIGWLGYRIRFRRDVHLIAGYRRGTTADTEALSRVVGRVVLVLAAVTAFAGVVYPILSRGLADGGIYWSGYTIVVLLLGGYAVVVSRRHVSNPDR